MRYDKEHPLRIFEAFAGYGSQSLAFKYLQEKHPDFAYEAVGCSDIEESAIKAYSMLHPGVKNYGDVTKIDWSEVPDFDFISWSSPCQDFSSAGLRRGGEEGSGTRSSLIWEERRMIEAKHPKYIMLENVKGLLTEKMRPYFFRYLHDLEEYGYTNFYQVLNARDYGIPQNRERIFVISIRRDGDEPQYHFPSPIPLTLTVEDVVEDDVDAKFFLNKEQVQKFVNLVDMEEVVRQYEEAESKKQEKKLADEDEILLQQLRTDV